MRSFLEYLDRTETIVHLALTIGLGLSTTVIFLVNACCTRITVMI